MYIEIKDGQTGETFRIERGEDKTFGRQGSPADIQVPDKAVSSRHAHIFLEDDAWILEDLKSSNGTFVDGQKITRLPLREGMRFSLYRYPYDVHQIGGAGGDATAMFENDPTRGDRPESATQVTTTPNEAPEEELLGGATRPITPKAMAAAMARDAAAEEPVPGAAAASRAAKPARPSDDEPPAPISMGKDSSKSAAKAPRGDKSGSARGTAGGSGPSGAPDEPWVPYVLKNLPGVLAYFLAAVPKLAVNPVGYVRRGIAEQTHPAFGKKELFVWAIPPMLFQLALTALAGLIVAILNGLVVSGLIGFVIGLAIGLGVSIVFGIISAFIFHPVLGWIIKFLKGESTPESRSNYYVALLTAVPLTAVGGALSLTLAGLPVPFLGALGPLVGIVTTALSTFIAWEWFRFFRVMKWVPIVIAVLGVLGALGSIKSAVDVVRFDIARLGSGGGSADVAAVAEAAEAAQAAAKAAADAMGKGGDAAAQEAFQKAMAAANQAAQGGGDAAAQAAALAAAQQAQAAQAQTQAAQAGSETPSGKVGTETAVKVTPAPSAPRGAQSDYPTFKSRRENIDKAIDADPTLLKRDGVEALYRKLVRAEAGAKAKHKTKPVKKPTPEQLAEQKLEERLRDAAVYEATVEIVDDLAAKLGL